MDAVGIRAGALLVVSVCLGFVIAAILGRISCEVSVLLDEVEPWASAPLTRGNNAADTGSAKLIRTSSPILVCHAQEARAVAL